MDSVFCRFMMILLGSNFLHYVFPDCVMFDEYVDNHAPLPYNGSAMPLNSSILVSQLRSICPHFFLDDKDISEKSLFCCNNRQLQSLQRNLALLRSMVGRCPACYANLNQLLCHLTCSPDQSKFMKVNRIQSDILDDPDNPSPVAVEFIANLTVRFSKSYGLKLFESCKDVIFPMTSRPSMEALCGVSYGCNAERLFQYMGSKGSKEFFTHFQMIDEKDEKIYFPIGKVRAWNCWQPFFDGVEDRKACSCSDCAAVCDIEDSMNGLVYRAKGAPFSSHMSSMRIAGMEVAHFTILVAFLIFLLLFFLAELWHRDDSIDEELLTDDEIQRLNLANQLNRNDAIFRSRSDMATKYPWTYRIHLYVDNAGFRMQQRLSALMQRVAIVCATHPLSFIFGAVAVIAAMSFGIFFYNVTSDPIELWSSPLSNHRRSKDVFDTNFGPFYRITQIILKPEEHNSRNPELDGLAQVFSKDILEIALNLTNTLNSLEFDHPLNKTHSIPIGFSRVCMKPMEPESQQCLIYSVSEYFQNDALKLDYVKDDNTLGPINYITHLRQCLSSPMTTRLPGSEFSCLSTTGMPMMPYMVLGGFEVLEDVTNDQSKVTKSYLETSKSLVITMIGRNMRKGDPDLALALTWEKRLIEWLHEYANSLKGRCSVTYRAERSIEDEIDRESHSDISTIAISYTIMFIYIAIALSLFGRDKNTNPEASSIHNAKTSYTVAGFILWIRNSFVKLRLTLALTGVMCAMISVVASVGFFSYLRFPTTLIVFEVVPFLVLAVGVDNIFLLTRSFQRVRSLTDRSSSVLTTKSSNTQLGYAVGQIGPSILLTGSAESIAFLMGTMTSVPAVRMFSLYASAALLIDLCLQLSAFISVMALDNRRQMSNRADLFCCFKMQRQEPKQLSKSDSVSVRAHSNVKNSNANTAQAPNGPGKSKSRSILRWYCRFLLRRKVRPLIILSCSTWVFSSIMIIGKLPLGLDPKLTVPQDSYVLSFMDDLQTQLRVGPPVYFMLISRNGRLDFESKRFRLALCGRSGCDTDSLVNQISWASRRSNLSRIAYGPSSWIDDYEQWMHPQSSCCFLNANQEYCSATEFRSSNLCTVCPVSNQFDLHLQNYLRDVPGPDCPLGGRAAYNEAIVFDHNNHIKASYFMTYHTLLVSSQDFIAALRSAEWLATNITLSLHSKGFTDAFVVPYSSFYVFYEQYLNIWRTTLINVSLSAFAIFLVSFVLLGFDLTSAMVIVVTIAMITVNLGGLMYLWNIELNAISLVNVVMSLGISVEFCAHIVREFLLITYGTRRQRARVALGNVGEAVFTGITLTKIVGISVLAFSHSQLFQVFYFRMYICIIFSGAVHGLVFLPVLLSYAGPSIRWTYGTDNSDVIPSNVVVPSVDKFVSAEELVRSSPKLDHQNEALLSAEAKSKQQQEV